MTGDLGGVALAQRMEPLAGRLDLAPLIARPRLAVGGVGDGIDRARLHRIGPQIDVRRAPSDERRRERER